MGYTETQNYISSLNTRGISPGLNNEIKLLEQLGNPHHNLKFIHIAGTNGKGSVGAYLSSVLVEAKNSVGRFVSPCVGEYKNTFLIDGEPVSEDIVYEATKRVQNAMDKLISINVYPTSFETEVALAFVIFNIIKPDYVLLECGMGGKNDATNVIPSPVLAVITKISMDHTAYLGSSIKDIATEKAGIIKKGTILVTCEQQSQTMDAIILRCTDESVPISISDTPTDILYNEHGTDFYIDGTKYSTKMLGTFQPQNASLAIKCAETLGIDHDAIDKGIKNAQWEYRFEKIGKFILDGAHNPDGAYALAQSIKNYFPNKELAYICGCFKDKEYDKIAKITAPYAAKVFCIKAPTNRGLDPEILRDEFQNNGTDAVTSSSLKDAIKEAEKYENVVIFGSLSILYEAKEIIEGI